MVVLTKSPLHLSANFFVVVNNEEFGIHERRYLLARQSWGGDRQQDPKDGSLAELTIYFNSTMVSFNNGFTLEHANANAFLFRRLERPKQRVLNELGCHATPIVGN